MNPQTRVDIESAQDHEQTLSLINQAVNVLREFIMAHGRLPYAQVSLILVTKVEIQLVEEDDDATSSTPKIPI